MPKFSAHFRLANSQAALDFVDIELDRDTRLYVDPFAIQIKEDQWSTACGDAIRSFFNQVLEALRTGRNERALELLAHLHEPNETRLGQSRGRPSGRGVGRDKAAWLAAAIRNSRAFETGVLSDISEAALYIKYVGSDTISDLTTNILRAKLAQYTTAQCELHGVETAEVAALPPAWDEVAERWRSSTYQLPLYLGRPVLLVPKYSVRLRMSLDSQEFYNHQMTDYLQQEYLNSGSGLIEVLKDGRRRVTKRAVKERHPYIKDELAEFVRQHPEVLNLYKEVKGAKGPIEDNDLEQNFDPEAFAEALSRRLREIPSGNAAADQYHELMIGVLTFLFYPNLIYPIKEQPLHGGRKRIDIKFTNGAVSGFFERALVSNQMRAVSVVVECKNYTDEIGNEEIDQLSGRFGHARGFLGLSVSRTMRAGGNLIARCHDTVADGRGFILPLVDENIHEMLRNAGQGRQSLNDALLNSLLDEISA